jgi:pimeloyl-ACP methyl ester carboxylesterase
MLIRPTSTSWSARYGRIPIPTLIMWGRHDAVIPVTVGQQLWEMIRTSQLVVFEDNAHVPQRNLPANSQARGSTSCPTPAGSLPQTRYP